MTSRLSGQAPEQPHPTAMPQMGTPTQGAQAQQSGDERPPQPGRSAPKPVRFTDWASI